MIDALLNHLWQSSLFALLMASMTLIFRHDRANVRFGLWFAASVKFLLPFALLTGLGETLRGDAFPGQEISRAWMEAAAPVIPQGRTIETLFCLIWAAGALLVITRWGREWRGITAIRRSATPIACDSPIPLLVTPARIEPGIVGFLRPVIVMPAEMVHQLRPDQLASVITHELCHWRRRDNFMALAHMLVEILFWYNPVIWWVGARMMIEREQACDEAVIDSGQDRQTYAEAILEVCRFQLGHALSCVSGAARGDLERRITCLIEKSSLLQLSLLKKILLVAVATLSFVGPAGIGLAVATPAPKFDLKSCPKPSYPAEARFKYQQGKTKLKVLVGADGRIKDAEVVESSGFSLLDDASKDSVMICNFVRAPGSDRILKGWYSLNYTWKLDEPSQR